MITKFSTILLSMGWSKNNLVTLSDAPYVCRPSPMRRLSVKRPSRPRWRLPDPRRLPTPHNDLGPAMSDVTTYLVTNQITLPARVIGRPAAMSAHGLCFKFPLWLSSAKQAPTPRWLPEASRLGWWAIHHHQGWSFLSSSGACGSSSPQIEIDNNAKCISNQKTIGIRSVNVSSFST